jgi:hypothetical protein
VAIAPICPKCHLSTRTHLERDGVEYCAGKGMGQRRRRYGHMLGLAAADRIAALPPGVMAFASQVARKHGYEVGRVLGRGRDPALCRARHELWSVVKSTLGLSYPATAALFGVDHSSVMHAERAYLTRTAFVAGERCDAP